MSEGERSDGQKARLGMAMVALGAFGFGLLPIFLFEGYAMLPASITVLVFYTYPAFTLVIARVLFGVRIEPRMLGTIVLVVFAATLILAPDAIEFGLMPAVFVTFGAPLGYSLYLVCLSRIPSDVDPALRTLLLTTAAGLVAGAYTLLVEGGLTLPVSTAGWVSLAGMTLVTGIVGIMLVVVGASLAGSARAAVAGSGELVTVLAVGWLLFGEVVTVEAVLGAGLIFGAIVISLPRERPVGKT
ncbi:MAG: DMT family transporter [Rhodospirillales bacterium]|nr:DMT family transporter [Rhodospirillales bacterium]